MTTGFVPWIFTTKPPGPGGRAWALVEVGATLADPFVDLHLGDAIGNRTASCWMFWAVRSGVRSLGWSVWEITKDEDAKLE